METKEQLAKVVETFVPKVMDTQAQFDSFMAALNLEQQAIITPLERAKQHYQLQRALLLENICELKAELQKQKVEWTILEHDWKEVNRTCHDIKHRLILLNPADQFKTTDGEAE